MLSDNKPVKLPIKDFLIRKLAVKMMLSEDTITNIVNFQAKDINRATNLHSTIEISGFGRLIFSRATAERSIKLLSGKLLLLKEKLEAEPNKESKTYTKLLDRYNKMNHVINDLKIKIGNDD